MSNLLEKASIILTPTAYNDGEALCVKPTDGSGDFDFSRNSAATRVNAQGLVENVQTISGNLLDYSTFTSPSASWSLVGGLWVFDDTANGYILTPNIAVVVGDVFDVVVDVTIASGNANLRYGSGNNQTVLFPFTDFVDGVNEFQATITGVDGNLERIFAPASLTDNPFTLNSISIKKISQDTNLPRINYEGGCGSWLFEPQSTNNISYSNDLSNWLSSGSNTLTSGLTSPSGDNTAYSVATGLGAGNRLIFVTSLSATNTQHTLSAFVKQANGYNIAYLRWGSSELAANIVNFAFDTETLTNVSGNSTDLFVENFGNGWYKIGFTFTTGSSITNQQAQINRGENVSASYWGIQLEQQSYATSLVPTDGSTVTRNQDVCDNGGSLASINSTEGVLYAEIAALGNSGTFRLIGLSDGTVNNLVYIGYDATANRITFSVRVATSYVFLNHYNISNATDVAKIALKYKENDFALWYNGTEISTDSSGVIFPTNTLTKLSFDRGGTLPFFGKTKCVAVWKEALTDAELTSLTTI